VYAVPWTNGPQQARDLAEAIRLNTPRDDGVDKDGRFELTLPGHQPLEDRWVLIAGGVGWTGGEVFPDPRPQSPAPTEVVEIRMDPVFATTVEVRMADGSRPSVSPSVVHASSSPGIYTFTGWSHAGPAREISREVLLALPEEHPPLRGGQDATIGFAGRELAVITGDWEEWNAGGKAMNYSLNLPGFELVEDSLWFPPLAQGVDDGYRITLEPLGPWGTIEFKFGQSAWWREHLLPAGFGQIRIELEALDPMPQRRAEREGEVVVGERPRQATEWHFRLRDLPDDDRLVAAGLPEGRYRVKVTAVESGLPFSGIPGQVVVYGDEREVVPIDLAQFGALRLELPDGQSGRWSEGRIEVSVMRDEQVARFMHREWPALIGPLWPGEVVLLQRSYDRKTKPQPLERLGGDAVYTVYSGVVTPVAVRAPADAN
jgi:hypothetical protein